jgi:glutamine phosphoribosylpyrophosphate amidotransferase
MCKIAILTSHTPTALRATVLTVWAAMAKTERDGFGAAWLSPRGTLRYIKSSNSVPGISLPEFFDGFTEGRFTRSNGGPVLIHARTATCGINAENTHPMLVGSTALIHNGVVSSERFQNTETTCDSELLTHAFRANGVKALETDITGYYAFAILEAFPRQRWTLDVVRDSRAPLVGGQLKAGGYAFATNDAVLASTGAKHLGKIKDNVHFRYQNGKHVLTETFAPKATISPTIRASSEKAFAHPWNDRTPPTPSTNWRQDTFDHATYGID